MKTFFAETLLAWHNWLIEHSDTEMEIWLVYYKKGSRVQGINYEESVEEALCFGWVDSLIKNLDEVSHYRKFTPRKPGSRWSEVNIARAEKMIAQGRMTEKGLRLFKDSETLKQPGSAKRKAQMEEWRNQLIENFEAGDKVLYQALPASLQRQYAGWVMSAAKEETRQKRLNELVDTLRRGERLGLK